MRYYFLITSFFASMIVYGQAVKRIHLRNGIVQQVPISTIDSITYSDGDQMVIHLSDRTLLQIPFNAIDSITYSVPVSPFNPGLLYGTITDIDGNSYKTIQIGSQIWMAENLRVTKFKNNITIPNISDSLQWAGIYDNNTQAHALAYYQNDPSNNSVYGKLYNWHAAVNTNGICPQGWHVPSDGEWTILTNFLGGESVAAGKMKSVGISYWKSPNVEATNSSGFSALAGGLRYYYSSFDFLFDFGTWWSATADNTTRSWARYLSYEYGSVFRTSSIKENGFSIRCLKD
jgi:uncharacterized protein (TIGR02145 family)